MDIQKFTLLVETTLKEAERKAGGAGHLTACLSRPSAKLSELYGPMTNKVLKDRAQAKAQSLYNEYSENAQFIFAIQNLGAKLERTGADATTGAVGAMGALLNLKDHFGNNLTKVLADVKEPPDRIEGILLAIADMSITGALLCVPVAGVFLAPLSQGIGGALKMAGGYADAAAGTGKSYDDGSKRVAEIVGDKELIGNMAASKGVASLIVTGLKIALKRRDAELLALPDSDEKSFAKLVGGTTFTQNQGAASCINALSRLDLRMPASLAADPRRTEKYITEKTALAEFATYTWTVFKEFHQFLCDVMTAGICGSFKDATSRLNTPRLVTDEQKISLLLLGYFYSKDWDGSRELAREALLERHIATQKRVEIQHEVQQQALKDAMASSGGHTAASYEAATGVNPISEDLSSHTSNLFKRISRLQADMRRTEGILESNRQMRLMLMTKTGLSTIDEITLGSSAVAARKLAQKATSKSNVIVPGFRDLDDLQKLPTFIPKVENYFHALKSALTADIETAMMKGNGGGLTDIQFQQMWKLFIGSQLIVNHAFNDSKVQLQSSGTTKFFRKLKPTTDATSIPDYYVKMIEDAGFIERYTGNLLGQVSTERKKDLAKGGKIRWSFSPSNTERAMLITFCTVVAFTLDVGKLSLGFYNWGDTVGQLRDVARSISATAWS